jgi:DNA-binding CsgD family transcriptional regulator
MKLTPREQEIVGLVKTGLSTKEIARKLGISPNTVHARLHFAYRKLGVRGREDLLLAEIAALKEQVMLQMGWKTEAQDECDRLIMENAALKRGWVVAQGVVV